MALSREQRSVALTIVRRGRQRRESAKEIKAAIETGLVESNLTNVKGGDRDSSGWRQERASSYPGKNRNDVRAAVDRFYDETSKVEGKYGRAHEIAQAVQKSGFPGRYKTKAGEAQQIIRGLDKGGTSTSGGGSTSTPDKTVTVPGQDNSALRKQIVLNYVQRNQPTKSDPYGAKQSGRNLELVAAIKGAQDGPDSKVTVPGSKKASAKGSGGSGGSSDGGRSDVREDFYNGPGGANVKDNKRVGKGFVSGHTDHTHAAFGTRAEAIRWGKVAQNMGLTVREQSHFDKVDPVHTKGSYHYTDRAIDVSGPPAKMAAFSRKVARARRGR